ncbi:MAG: DNA gyrase inhibitor YacG [bacterium]
MNCPSCNKPVEWEGNPFRPFCSERCKLIDLGRWVDEEYRVPGREVPMKDAENVEDDSESARSNPDGV